MSGLGLRQIGSLPRGSILLWLVVACSSIVPWGCCSKEMASKKRDVEGERLGVHSTSGREVPYRSGMAIEADTPSLIWKDSSEVLSSAFPGWLYWKTLGDEDKVFKVKMVARSSEVGSMEEPGFVRLVPLSDWEVAGTVHQMAPNRKGSIEFDAGINDGEVLDPKGVKYVAIVDHRYLAWNRKRIIFKIHGHSEREVRAIPVQRKVRLEWCAGRDFDTNAKVLLRATEYACVLVVR